MKTMLVTGGGRGLGKVTAEKLARAGHKVVLVARSLDAANRAAEDIRKADPGANVEPLGFDLASLAAVKEGAAQLAAKGGRLDVLFHIAGVMQQSPTRRLSRDGFEETLAVNVLAPFVLTHGLLPLLERAPRGRIITVSSRLHLPDSRGPPVHFDFEDPFLERGYNPDRAYKNSKLAVLWFTYGLHRRLPPRTMDALAVCPGFVPVTAAESTHGLTRFFMRHVLSHMPFAQSLEDATNNLVYMALEATLEGAGGQFYGEKRVLESSPESHDAAKADRFWSWAQEVTGTGVWPAPYPETSRAVPVQDM